MIGHVRARPRKCDGLYLAANPHRVSECLAPGAEPHETQFKTPSAFLEFYSNVEVHSMNASNILSYFSILRKPYTASPDELNCLLASQAPRIPDASPLKACCWTSSFRRLILHLIESPFGRHCSSQPDLSSIEGFAGRKNAVQMYGRGKFGSLVE
jgi:hypothetical protein